MEKNFLPISINIAHQKILILGGGQDAFKKIEILKRFNAEVEVLARTICDDIKSSDVKYYEMEYDEKYLKGYLMLYSCLNNKEMDKKIVKDAQAAGVLVNIHDNPELCQFVSPAIYRQGNISVAVSSNGENVYESIRIRNLIQNKLQLN